MTSLCCHLSPTAQEIVNCVTTATGAFTPPTKVVIWLPVNRLPVKLPVTGFNFQLLVTDLPTFLLHVIQFSASSSFHTHTDEQRQAYIGPRLTGAVRRLGPVGSGLPGI